MKSKPNKKRNQPAYSPPVVPKWALAGILAITAIVYSRAVFCDFVGYDDNAYIRDNTLLRDLSWNGLWVIFRDIYFTLYHPLTVFSYWVEYNLFGAGPIPYHLTNVILHLLNTLLAFKLAVGLSNNRLVGVIVSLLFALHPMHVESVAWVSERKDVLYAFFFLLSLLYYVRYIQSGLTPRLYLWMLIAFVASLMSKPSAVTLPVVLVAIDWYMGRKWDRRAIAEKVPLFALSLVFGLVASSQQGDMTDYYLNYSLFDRVLLVTHNLSFYLIKLFVPTNLSAIYYYPIEEFGKLSWTYYASLPFILLCSYLLYRWSGFRKEVLFGVGFFLVTISVMLQIYPFGRAIRCDRYTYIPYLGLFYLFAQWITISVLPRWKSAGTIFLFSVLTLFGIGTFLRIGVWRNSETLFTDIIKKSPGMPHSYAARAMFRYDLGNIRGALSDYNKALILDPLNAGWIGERARIRGELGDAEGAMADLNTALRIDSTYAEGYLTRGVAKLHFGDPRGALEDLNTGIRISPLVWPETYNSRAYVRALLKDYKGAVEDYTRFLEKNPYDTAAYTNLGIIQMHLADTSQACEAFQKGERLGCVSSSRLRQQFCR